MIKTLHSVVTGSNPGQGTKIPLAECHGQNHTDNSSYLIGIRIK